MAMAGGSPSTGQGGGERKGGKGVGVGEEGGTMRLAGEMSRWTTPRRCISHRPRTASST